jgi:hypothetical protein
VRRVRRVLLDLLLHLATALIFIVIIGMVGMFLAGIWPGMPH